MPVGCGLEVTQRRQVPAHPPKSRPAHRDTRLGVEPPADGRDRTERFARTKSRIERRRAAQPKFDGGFARGATKPITPFQERSFFARKERRGISVIGVAVVPRFTAHLNFPEEPGCPCEPFLNFRGCNERLG